MKGYKRSQKYIPGQSFKKKFKKHNPKNCTLEKSIYLQFIKILYNLMIIKII